MTTVPHVPSPEDGMPLPPRQMNMYLTFWHVIYLGVLGLMLWYAWTTFGAVQLWRAAALTGLVAGQVALYLWNFVFNSMWPLPRWRITFYFLGSAALWLIEWQLDPTFQWIGVTYFGQMMGTLPPVAALPASLIVFSLVFIVSPDFKFGLTDLASGRTIGPLLGWAASIVFYLFVFYITRTSTARGRLVAELRAAQAELEAAHARDTELAALRERERLARDLHDSLGHALVAISVQLEAIQRLYRVDPERAHAQVDTLKGATRAAMDELRRSLEGLRAPGLGDRPLADALRSLAVETGQQHNLEVACHIDLGSERLSPAVAEVFWRVAQEGLTNVARHAQARHVDLRLIVTAAAAVLSVHDDGRGLPNEVGAAPAAGHYGLLGLRERVEGVAGTLTVRSQGGVTIEARVPLR